MEGLSGDEITRMRAFLEEGMPRYIAILGEMIAINSFTGNASGVNRLGRYTAELFGRLGFEAEYVPSAHGDECGSHLVLTRTGTSALRIGCVSHLDTVFTEDEERDNDFRFRIEGDRVYGPGANDIKGGTVVMLMMLEALLAVAPRIFGAVSWVLLFDATEETESDDFGALCVERIGPAGAACLVFEGGDMRDGAFRLVTARKGRAVFRIVATGKGAHAGVSHREGANAIVQLAESVLRVSELTDYEQGLTVNIGYIEGGIAINRVAHLAEAVGEIRAYEHEVLAQGLKGLAAINGLSTVASADGVFRCRTSVKVLRKNPAWQENDATKRLFGYYRRAAVLMGMEAEPVARGGLSDGNFTWRSVPTIDGLGPEGANEHCSERSADGSKDQEYALVPSFVPKAILSALALCLIVAGKD
ncbi:MAG TPA: M20/M25/M40 family metallo-hydrolase [Spirochaetota bacterium]|nr:M20/M25/M40 family metallo-hydrolase [Spirochaetota bacterium]